MEGKDIPPFPSLSKAYLFMWAPLVHNLKLYLPQANQMRAAHPQYGKRLHVTGLAYYG
jgi:hypothetical protein